MFGNHHFTGWPRLNERGRKLVKGAAITSITLYSLMVGQNYYEALQRGKADVSLGEVFLKLPDFRGKAAEKARKVPGNPMFENQVPKSERIIII